MRTGATMGDTPKGGTSLLTDWEKERLSKVEKAEVERDRLRKWIDDLEVVERHSGKTDRREWGRCGEWLHPGDVIYIGKDKP